MSQKVTSKAESNPDSAEKPAVAIDTTRCTTDKDIKIGKYVPSSDSGDNKENEIEIEDVDLEKATTEDLDGDIENEASKDGESADQVKEESAEMDTDVTPDEEGSEGNEGNEIESTTRITKVYSTPKPRKMPDHYIDDV